MKNINIMFFLVLVLALVACGQETQGDSVTPGSGNPGQAGASEEESYEGITDEERKVATERLRTETAKAFKALKKTRDDYSNEINIAMKAYDAIEATTKHVIAHRVEIPALTGFTREKDSAKIYASLGYDGDLINKLNDSIISLRSSDGNIHAREIKIAAGIFRMLVELDDATNKILDTHLKDDNLAKIEKNKAKIDTATKELNAFIASRKEFIASIEKSIEAARSNEIRTPDEAKAELNKLIATTAVTSDTVAGEAGYCHSRVEAVKKNEKTLAGLFS
ncbi:hypothetical protein [Borrelia sp. P9F1]|uniref:hypothetical protein n=1 Tax=Borrelia sp. P9F1 TaxID=3058374 RepID=UPI0026475375|nr:hypothetical protein [Borrelia sp. P9F1]WKC58683.1 hypothetical protein QYZ68_05625 [Borrelia sp. P9F1]